MSTSAEALLLDGARVAREVKAGLKARLQQFPQGRRPGLAVVTLGTDPAGRKYATSKAKACREMGMECTLHDFSGDLRPAVLQAGIRALAADASVHGLLIEHPLPVSVDPLELYACIPFAKDVEGLSHENLGRLFLGRPATVASTAGAVMRILDDYHIEPAGRRAVIVGRSNVVGKPLCALLLARDATVTVCHSHTRGLAEETTRADILVVAVGRARMVGAEHVRPGAVVVDVGINFEHGRMVGDVDFEAVRARAGAITPVPGGVGPVTTAMLLSNLVETAARQLGVK